MVLQQAPTAQDQETGRTKPDHSQQEEAEALLEGLMPHSRPDICLVHYRYWRMPLAQLYRLIICQERCS